MQVVKLVVIAGAVALPLSMLSMGIDVLEPLSPRSKLDQAVTEGKPLSALQAMLHGADPMYVDRYGHTSNLLLMAVIKRHTGLVCLLLQKGARPNSGGTNDRFSPLAYAEQQQFHRSSKPQEALIYWLLLLGHSRDLTTQRPR